MDRRKVIVSGIATGLATGITAAGGAAFAQDPDDYQHKGAGGDAGAGGSDYRRGDDHGGGDDQGRDQGRDYGGPTDHPAATFSREEMVRNVSDFFGVTAENAGAIIEKIFHENG